MAGKFARYGSQPIAPESLHVVVAWLSDGRNDFVHIGDICGKSLDKILDGLYFTSDRQEIGRFQIFPQTLDFTGERVIILFVRQISS